MHPELRRRFPEMAYIDPTARVYGRVEIGGNSSLWPYAVIRAECGLVRLGRFTNVQDHVMVHVGFQHPTIVGDYCSITHRVVLHGCTVGDDCLIGIGATIMDGAVVGAGSIIAGHSFIAENARIPENSVVMGTPGRVVRTRDNRAANRLNALAYYRNALGYVRGDHRAWEGDDFVAQMAAWRDEIATGGDGDGDRDRTRD
jgi:carbonic anhydrase/acetyltransferase-like protein (isoleucine patch superfamily)